MKKRTKQFLMGTGIATAVVSMAGVGLSFLRTASRIMADIALDRIEPKQMKTGKKPPRLEVPEEIAETLQSYADRLEQGGCETVEITAHDGEKLVGHWREAKNTKRIIIAMHGWRSSWAKDFGLIADFWYREGCSVLYAEQRGQGNSGGDYMGFGMVERYDCLDWIQWVSEKVDAHLPIYLAGISMGASTVLMAGGFDLPQRVNGIMADCGFTSARDIWKHVVDGHTGFSYNLHSKDLNNLCKEKIQVGPEDYTTIDALKECCVPVLFIHGTEDYFVPIQMTYENYKACKSPKMLFVVPGAGHAMSYLVDKKGYERYVSAFWEQYDA